MAVMGVSCAVVVPDEVLDGNELPGSLAVCNKLYVDANDRIYNLIAEVRHLNEEIELLKKK